jgi:hypothetical protein
MSFGGKLSRQRGADVSSTNDPDLHGRPFVNLKVGSPWRQVASKCM